MALPRKCSHCKCFAAPWLKRCIRCDKPLPVVAGVVKLTKEERLAERAKLDVGVPIIHQSKMQWLPSKLAIESHRVLLDEARRKLERAESATERNGIRSEIRSIKALLKRTADAKHRWTTELFHAKTASIHVFVSPKGHRYVTAPPDKVPDLLIKNKRSSRMAPFSRLQRFEKSPYFKMQKAEKQQERVHTTRKKAKRQQRLSKRKQLP